jgi:hypothetical protein
MEEVRDKPWPRKEAAVEVMKAVTGWIPTVIWLLF